MSFDIVCFDCDSTLSTLEGIDELARYYELDVNEIARLTLAAMNGDMPLESVYGRRLSEINPDRASINWLASRYLEEITEGAEAVCRELSSHGKELHIISSGIRQAILPLAERLDFPRHHVHAVDLYFQENGSYVTYDRRSPLTRSCGKAEVCKLLLEPGKTLLMVGDSASDLAAKQSGVAVLGFGGVVERAKVREQADFYCSGPSLTTILPHIL